VGKIKAGRAADSCSAGGFCKIQLQTSARNPTALQADFPKKGFMLPIPDVRIVDLIMALLQKIHSEKQHQDASGRDKLSHPQSKHAS